MQNCNVIMQANTMILAVLEERILMSNMLDKEYKMRKREYINHVVSDSV